MKLSNPHDRFFTKVLSDIKQARDYLLAFLPDDICKAIDFDTLRREDKSFTDDLLKGSLADLVFSAETREGQTVNFCFLFEHKSYLDKSAPFQILHYISSAMLQQSRNKKAQRLIIPILVYHGQQEWSYQPIRNSFKELNEVFKQYLPDFEFLFHNFQSLPDEEIKRLENSLLATALLMLKHFYDTGYLEQNATFLLLGAVDEQGNFFKPGIVYFFSRFDYSKTKTEHIMNQLPEHLETEKKTLLDAIIEEGEEKKTRQACSNMIKLNFEDEMICKIQEVTPQYVQELRHELANDSEA